MQDTDTHVKGGKVRGQKELTDRSWGRARYRWMDLEGKEVIQNYRR